MKTYKRSVAVFDLGGVVIDWNPRHLYRKLFNGNEAAMEHFLANVCTSSWNLHQDAGRSFAEATRSLKAMYPQQAELIGAWFDRFDEMMAGPIAGAVEILDELRSSGVPIYALSNWSAETFPVALKRFECLGWFRGVLLSGNVKLIKPDRRIFETFFKTYSIEPSEAVYIDDLKPNVDVASALGMHGILFGDSATLRGELAKAGLLKARSQFLISP